MEVHLDQVSRGKSQKVDPATVLSSEKTGFALLFTSSLEDEELGRGGVHSACEMSPWPPSKDVLKPRTRGRSGSLLQGDPCRDRLVVWSRCAGSRWAGGGGQPTAYLSRRPGQGRTTPRSCYTAR